MNEKYLGYTRYSRNNYILILMYKYLYIFLHRVFEKNLDIHCASKFYMTLAKIDLIVLQIMIFFAISYGNNTLTLLFEICLPFFTQRNATQPLMDVSKTTESPLYIYSYTEFLKKFLLFRSLCIKVLYDIC